MPKTPSYRKRKNYAQAIVTLTDSATGKRRDYWLGEHGTPGSRKRYHRIIAQWEADDRRLPECDPENLPRQGDATPGATISELVRLHWRWAVKYYQPNESGTLKVALRLLRLHYGQTPAADFGPRKFRLLREAMINAANSNDGPRRAWSRGYINQQCARIRRMFKWGCSHELVPASVHQALDAVQSLKRGRTTAKDNDAVGPVPQILLDGARPFLNRQVAALVALQLLTAARGGELLKMRAIDLDTTDRSGIWTFRPLRHKNLHRGKDRVIYLGPGAQEVVRPFLRDRPVDAYLFSPAEAECERRAAVHAARKTPHSCGNKPGSNRVETPRKKAGEHYEPASYYKAIQTACDAAFPPPQHLLPQELPDSRRETEAEFVERLMPAEKAELAAWRRAHRWHLRCDRLGPSGNADQHIGERRYGAAGHSRRGLL